jgi:hypothetical protein
LAGNRQRIRPDCPWLEQKSQRGRDKLLAGQPGPGLRAWRRSQRKFMQALIIQAVLPIIIAGHGNINSLWFGTTPKSIAIRCQFNLRFVME